MPEHSPGYLTLKFNKTSVMLYANDYVKLSSYRASSTTHTYLGSFPVTATEVPEKFDALLREGTRGQPERYQELMHRITERVLAPARIRRDRELERRALQAIEHGLSGGAADLAAIPELPQYAHYIRRAELQMLLKVLLDQCARLSTDFDAPKTPSRDPEPDEEGPLW